MSELFLRQNHIYCSEKDVTPTSVMDEGELLSIVSIDEDKFTIIKKTFTHLQENDDLHKLGIEHFIWFGDDIKFTEIVIDRFNYYIKDSRVFYNAILLLTKQESDPNHIVFYKEPINDKYRDRLHNCLKEVDPKDVYIEVPVNELQVIRQFIPVVFRCEHSCLADVGIKNYSIAKMPPVIKSLMVNASIFMEENHDEFSVAWQMANKLVNTDYISKYIQNENRGTTINHHGLLGEKEKEDASYIT